jgi:uncharacterized protein (UPF0548 family)
MWFLRRPADAVIAAFLAKQRLLPLSYDAVGATRGQDWPAGFNHDRNRITLGQGPLVFERAVEGLRAWRMFPAPWTAIVPSSAPQKEVECVSLLIRAFGVWWMSAARVIYEVDETGGEVKRRVGFAYGTLPGHVEKGEERFTVAWLPDDSVQYELSAFSRPRHWMVRLGKPLARGLQRRFVRQSLEAMRRLANENA